MVAESLAPVGVIDAWYARQTLPELVRRCRVACVRVVGKGLAASAELGVLRNVGRLRPRLISAPSADICHSAAPLADIQEALA